MAAEPPDRLELVSHDLPVFAVAEPVGRADADGGKQRQSFRVVNEGVGAVAVSWGCRFARPGPSSARKRPRRCNNVLRFETIGATVVALLVVSSKARMSNGCSVALNDFFADPLNDLIETGTRRRVAARVCFDIVGGDAQDRSPPTPRRRHRRKT